MASAAAAHGTVADANRAMQAQAWTAFWQEQGADSRCLANLAPDVRRILDQHWSAFAATLAPTSRILDVGCGAGAVGRSLLAAEGRLRITGIDLADVPAPADRRIALLPGTPMEDLPFDDRSFDASVSQFGFEYGDVRKAANEMARVLVPGGRFSFLVHHAHSTIVGQSRDRSFALRGLLGEKVRTAFRSGNAAELDRHVRSIRRGAPADPIFDQLASVLRARIGGSGAQRAAIWSAVAEALAPEREILDALEHACVAAPDLDRWIANFPDRFEIGAAAAIRRPTGEAIAWKIEGVKRRLPLGNTEPTFTDSRRLSGARVGH